MRPVITGTAVLDGSSAQFRLKNKTVTISAPRELLTKLLDLCQGDLTLAEVREALLPWDQTEVTKLLDHLVTERVLRDVSDVNWDDVKNPHRGGGVIPAPREPSVRGTHAPSFVLPVRRSVRSFSEETVDLQKIVDMLWAAYGYGERRAVPSAGGLYPLELTLVLNRPTGSLDAGVYRVRYGSNGVDLVRVGNLRVELLSGWIDSGPIVEAHGTVIISGELDRTAQKYGPRAALYVPIEVGAAAQNFARQAAEVEVGTVLVGGFIEDELQRQLSLSSIPLISIPFGYPATRETCHSPFVWLRSLLGRTIVTTEGSWGIDDDPELAYLKCVAEREERRACGRPQGTYRARASELPDSVMHETDDEMEWVRGVTIDVRRRSVPAHLVYYRGLPESEYRFGRGTSSGAAAGFTWHQAIRAATYEVVERDGVMTAWYEERPIRRVVELPSDVQAQLDRFTELGYQVHVRDVTNESYPVIMVVGQHHEKMVTRVAAACDSDATAALRKALLELDLLLSVVKVDPIEAEDVKTAIDHGRFYAGTPRYRAADRLLRSHGDVSLYSIQNGWRKLEPIEVWLNDARVSYVRRGRVISEHLYVVKTLIPGLRPLQFGYDGSAHPHPFT